MIDKFYCVGHRAPLFDPKVDYQLVSPEPHLGSECFRISDDSLGPEFHGNFLSEYTQLIGLIDTIERLGFQKNHFIYIFQYRKFISFKNTGSVATNIPYCYPCTADQASGLFPNCDELGSLAQFTLLGPSIKINSYAKNYAVHHEITDFVNFILSMKSYGFSDIECSDFSGTNIFFPAPALGAYNAEFLIETCTTLKEVWRIFFSKYYVPRSGYQRRVGGFLLERLHSYLLLKAIKSRKFEDLRQGFQIVVSDSLKVSPTI